MKKLRGTYTKHPDAQIGVTRLKTAEKQPSNAQRIRNALKKLGIDASAKDVQKEVLARGGVEPAPAQISNIRTKLKEGKVPKRGRGKSADDQSFTESELTAAHQILKQLIRRLGSHERAVGVVSLFDRLQKPGTN